MSNDNKETKTKVVRRLISENNTWIFLIAIYSVLSFLIGFSFGKSCMVTQAIQTKNGWMDKQPDGRLVFKWFERE